MSPTLNCSRAVTRMRALLWTLLHSPTCGVAIAGTLWSGMVESKGSPRVMTTCPIIGQAAGGAVADEQRRRSPQLQTCQAGPGTEDAPEPPGHPNLGSDLHREGSKSQNILLKRFLTSLLKNCFLADTQQMPPVYVSRASQSQSVQTIAKQPSLSNSANLTLSIGFKISNLKIFNLNIL